MVGAISETLGGWREEEIQLNSPGCICPIPQMTISVSQERHRLEALTDYTSFSLLLCEISFLSKETKDLLYWISLPTCLLLHPSSGT